MTFNCLYLCDSVIIAESVNIVEQPRHHIYLDDGPTIGKSMRLVLKVDVAGWPPPTYQWFRNGKLIDGAQQASLVLNLKCPLSQLHRSYRYDLLNHALG